MNRQINEFNLTIEGEIEQISIETLVDALESLNRIFLEVNQEVDSNHTAELTIKTYKPGSFDIYLQLLVDATALGAASRLFNKNSMAQAKALIDVVSTVWELKKKLKGKKPKEIKQLAENKVEITSNNGNVIIVDQITYNICTDNLIIDSQTSKLFDLIQNIPYTQGLSLKNNTGTNLFNADKKKGDFKAIIKPNPLLEEQNISTTDKLVPEAILSVFGVVFDNARNWEFFYEGHKIPARLADKDFLDGVLRGRFRFGSGDRLKCNMTIHQKYNEIADVFENKKYTINKVIDIIPRAPQLEL